jgi:hypothetical protein
MIFLLGREQMNEDVLVDPVSDTRDGERFHNAVRVNNPLFLLDLCRYQVARQPFSPHRLPHFPKTKAC